MQIDVDGEVIEWRGPAPYLFVALPEDESEVLRERPELSYGWGCIRMQARIGDARFETSLMPRGGRYLLPIKVAVQRAEDIEAGDRVVASIVVEESGRRS